MTAPTPSTISIVINVGAGTTVTTDYTPRFNHLEDLIMTTKAELEVKVDELSAAQAEAASDLTRILDELSVLVEAQDLTAIAAKVDEAKAVAVAMSAAADAAVADPTDVPPVPEA